MNSIKRYRFIFLGLTIFLISFSVFAQATSDDGKTFFDILTSSMFDSVIDTFGIKPKELNYFQQWILGLCIFWEMGSIILLMSAGSSSFKRSFDFVLYLFISLIFLGLIEHQMLTGNALNGVGGKYEGMYLDLDLYNFVNNQGKKIGEGIGKKAKTLRDTDAIMEGTALVTDYCSYQSGGQCINNGLKKLTPNGDGFIDPLFVADLKNYISTKEGCTPDSGILKKQLIPRTTSTQDNSSFLTSQTNEDEGIVGSAFNSIKDGISSQFAGMIAPLNCVKSKINKYSSMMIPGQGMASFLSGVLNTIINALVGVLINLLLVANLVELLFMLVFARYFYPFFIVDGQRSKVWDFVKAFVAFGLVPLLMKIGFWVTDEILAIVLKTFFADPVTFLVKFFASPSSGSGAAIGAAVTGAAGTGLAVAGGAAATAAGVSIAAPGLPAIALGLLIGLFIAIAALKLAVLMRLTKLTRDLFNLEFKALYGIGRDAMSSFGKISAIVGSMALTAGAGLGAMIGISKMGGGGALASKFLGGRAPSLPGNQHPVAPSDAVNLNNPAAERNDATVVTEIKKPVDAKIISGEIDHIKSVSSGISPKKFQEYTQKDLVNRKTELMTGRIETPKSSETIINKIRPWEDTMARSEFLKKKGWLEESGNVSEVTKTDVKTKSKDETSTVITKDGKGTDLGIIKFNPDEKKPSTTKKEFSNNSEAPTKKDNRPNSENEERKEKTNIKDSEPKDPWEKIAKLIGEEVAKALGASKVNEEGKAAIKSSKEKEIKAKELEEEQNEAAKILESETLRTKGYWDRVADNVKLLKAKSAGVESVISGGLHVVDKIFNEMDIDSAMNIHKSTAEAFRKPREEAANKQMEYILSRIDADGKQDGFNTIEDYSKAIRNIGSLAHKLGLSVEQTEGMIKKSHPVLAKEYEGLKKTLEKKQDEVYTDNDSEEKE